MTSAREAIFAKIEQLLTALPSVAEVERMPSGDPDKFPALHIWDEGQRPEQSEAGVTEYGMTFNIDGYVEAAGGSAAHMALNALHSAMVQALVTEPPIGGLVDEITEGVMNVSIAPLASKRRLAFTAEFTVNFPTARGNPEVI